jgi:tetratricopeptide (TPR) repeat protein
MDQTCPEGTLREMLEAMAADEAGAAGRLEALLGTYPEDSRLHFLHGSLLAAAGHFGAAQDSIARAIRIAPDYAIARFQLGFLQFTSGDAAAATVTWRPLLERGGGDALRLFVEGLEALAVDDFPGAAERLRRGIAANDVNPPLNADMERLLNEIEARRSPAEEETPLSLTQLALQQSAARGTRH